MKKNILLIASGSFMALHGVSAAAQETPPADTTVETETTTATPTANGEGAVVTREKTTTTTTTTTVHPASLYCELRISIRRNASEAARCTMNLRLDIIACHFALSGLHE